MKIWISDIKEKTHRIIKLNCEEHSQFQYFGDFNDKELKNILLDFQDTIDVEKNIKLLKYYGYLHLFIIIK